MTSGRGPAMGWDEWARHDGTALAALLRKGELSPRDIAAQVAEGVGRAGQSGEGSGSEQGSAGKGPQAL